MYAFHGFYTLGELLCQLEHPDLLPIAQLGLSLRLDIEETSPLTTVSGRPDVEIWPTGLVFGIPQALLLKFAREIAAQTDRTLPPDAEGFIGEVFPNIWESDLANEGEERPLRVVEQLSNPRGILLRRKEMRPHTFGAFQLLHPLKPDKIVVPLQIIGAQLVATVPHTVVRGVTEQLAARLGY